MSCAACREAVSATLDGEPPGVAQRGVDEHLDRCAACRSWAEAAAEVTRRARLVAAPPVPDVTGAVLSRLTDAGSRPDRNRRTWWDAGLRLALLAVGTGQLAVSLPVLAGGSALMAASMAAPVHLDHESGAWNLGLAACFLVVALRPRLAPGALPFLLPFTAVLSWVTVSDLGGGHVPPGRAVGHLLLVGGALLISALALYHRAPRGGPAGAERIWSARTGSGRRAGAGTAAGHGDVATDWPRDASAQASGRRAA